MRQHRRRRVAYAESRGKLSNSQHGFRPGRSCPEAIFVVREVIESRQSRGQATFVCFLDIKRAYDTVCRKSLLRALFSAGVRGKMLRIAALHTGDTASIRLRETLSESFDVRAGVKQGDPLAPLLYVLFIDPLLRALEAAGVGVKIDATQVPDSFFADDGVLLCPDAASLDRALRICEEFAQQWGFSFHADAAGEKSAVLFCPGEEETAVPQFTIGGMPIARKEVFTYLGAILSVHDRYCTAQWSQALLFARRRFVLCKRAGVKAHGFPVRANRTRYSLRSFLCSSTPWRHCHGPPTAWWRARSCCPTFSATPLVSRSSLWWSVTPDLNIAPLIIRRHRSILRAFHRFTSGTSTQITQALVAHSVFRAASHLRAPRARPACWALQLHEALTSFRLLDVWDTVHPLRAIRLLDQATWYARIDDATSGVIHRWRAAELQLRSHLLCYRSFALGCRFASYLYLNNPLLRSFITSLRAGSLHVQDCKPALRYLLSPVLKEAEYCPFCTARVRECVYHFLLHCKSTDHLRPAAAALPAYGLALIPTELRDSLSTRRVALAAGMKPIVFSWYAMWRHRRCWSNWRLPMLAHCRTWHRLLMMCRLCSMIPHPMHLIPQTVTEMYSLCLCRVSTTAFYSEHSRYSGCMPHLGGPIPIMTFY